MKVLAVLLLWLEFLLVGQVLELASGKVDLPVLVVSVFGLADAVEVFRRRYRERGALREKTLLRELHTKEADTTEFSRTSVVF